MQASGARQDKDATGAPYDQDDRGGAAAGASSQRTVRDRPRSRNNNPGKMPPSYPQLWLMLIGPDGCRRAVPRRALFVYVLLSRSRCCRSFRTPPPALPVYLCEFFAFTLCVRHAFDSYARVFGVFIRYARPITAITAVTMCESFC